MVTELLTSILTKEGALVALISGYPFALFLRNRFEMKKIAREFDLIILSFGLGATFYYFIQSLILPWAVFGSLENSVGIDIALFLTPLISLLSLTSVWEHSKKYKSFLNWPDLEEGVVEGYFSDKKFLLLFYTILLGHLLLLIQPSRMLLASFLIIYPTVIIGYSQIHRFLVLGLIEIEEKNLTRQSKVISYI